MYLNTTGYNPDNLKDRIHTPYLTFLENALFPIDTHIIELCLNFVTKNEIHWTRKKYSFSKDFFESVQGTAKNIKLFIKRNSCDKYITKGGVVQLLTTYSDYSTLGDDLHTFENELFELIKLQETTQKLLKKLDIKDLESLSDIHKRKSYIGNFILANSYKKRNGVQRLDTIAEAIDLCVKILEAFEELYQKLNGNRVLQHKFSFLNDSGYYDFIQKIMGDDFDHELFVLLSSHKTIDFVNNYTLDKELLIWLSKNIHFLENQKYEQVLKKIISLQNHAGFSDLLIKIESLFADNYDPKTLLIYCIIFEKTSKIMEHNKETIEKFFKLGIPSEKLCLYSTGELDTILEFNAPGFSWIQLMKDQKTFQNISFEFYSFQLKNIFSCIFDSEILSRCKKIFENISQENAEKTYYEICSYLAQSGIERDIQEIKDILSRTTLEKEKKLFLLQVLHDNFGKSYLEIYNNFSGSELRILYEIFLQNRDFYSEENQIGEVISFLRSLIQIDTTPNKNDYSFGEANIIREKTQAISEKFSLGIDDLETYLEKYSPLEKKIVLKKIEILFGNLKQSLYSEVELVILGDTQTIDEIIKLQKLLKNFQEIGIYNFDYDFLKYCMKNYEKVMEKIIIISDGNDELIDEHLKKTFILGDVKCIFPDTSKTLDSGNKIENALLTGDLKFQEDLLKEIQSIITVLQYNFDPAHVSSTRKNTTGKGSGTYANRIRSHIISKLKKKNETNEEYLMRMAYFSMKDIFDGVELGSRHKILGTLKKALENYNYVGFFSFVRHLDELIENIEKVNKDTQLYALKSSYQKEVLI